jgi:hypothetical protein
VEARVFGYYMEAVFHRDATSLLENSGRLGTMNSGAEGCIGRKLEVVDGVEGSCAVVNLLSSAVILGRQKLSHVLVRILIRSMDVRSTGH